MKKFYRASIGKMNFPYTKATTPNGAWKKLEDRMDQTREQLRERGYRVNLVVDFETSDALIAADVVEAALPKKLGIIARLARSLFG